MGAALRGTASKKRHGHGWRQRRDRPLATWFRRKAASTTYCRRPGVGVAEGGPPGRRRRATDPRCRGGVPHHWAMVGGGRRSTFCSHLSGEAAGPRMSVIGCTGGQKPTDLRWLVPHPSARCGSATSSVVVYTQRDGRMGGPGGGATGHPAGINPLFLLLGIVVLGGPCSPPARTPPGSPHRLRGYASRAA